MDYVSVSEAAERLSLDVSRVRAMLATGQLDGEKLGGRWAIPVSSVSARALRGRPAGGRPFTAANAWAVLALASGQRPELDARSHRRLAALLSEYGLRGLSARLASRAQPNRFRAHPGVLGALSHADEVHAAGISAAAGMGLGLVAGNELDAYVNAGAIASLMREYALEPVGAGDPSGNVMLRAVRADVMPYLAELPRAAVALDLSQQPDRRSARIGRQELERLDREQFWQSSMPASAPVQS